MNTGGPAFPGTLLDWFAGQALEWLLSNQYRKRDVEQYAADAYTWASAMLAEKARREAVVKESSTADHSGEANKMVELEAQNRELVERIKRLEEAGDAMHRYYDASSRFKWGEAREIKP